MELIIMFKKFVITVVCTVVCCSALLANAEWSKHVEVDQSDGSINTFSWVNSRDRPALFVLAKNNQINQLYGFVELIAHPPECFEGLPQVEMRIDDLSVDRFLTVIDANGPRIGVFFETGMEKAFELGSFLKIRLDGCNFNSDVVTFGISGAPELNY